VPSIVVNAAIQNSGSGAITLTGPRRHQFGGANFHGGRKYHTERNDGLGTTSTLNPGTGTIVLGGNVTVNASSTAASFLQGQLDLGGGRAHLHSGRLVRPVVPAILSVSAVISNGGLTKSGSGNTDAVQRQYLRRCDTISGGVLEVTVNNALGTNGRRHHGGRRDLRFIPGRLNYSTAEAVTINDATGVIESSADDVSFAGNILLATAGEIQAVTAGKTLTLSGTIDSSVAAQDLTLNGAGNLTFTNILGGTLAVNSITQSTGTGLTTFQQDVTLGSGSSVFNQSVTLDGLTLISAGAVTFGCPIGDMLPSSGGATTITDSAANKAVTVNAGVTMNADLNIATGTATATLTAVSTNANALTVPETASISLAVPTASRASGVINLRPLGRHGLDQRRGQHGDAAIEQHRHRSFGERTQARSRSVSRRPASTRLTSAPVTFRDPVTFYAPGTGGSVTVNGTLAGTTMPRSPSRIRATTTLNADITTAGDAIAIHDACCWARPRRSRWIRRRTVRRAGPISHWTRRAL